MSRTVKTIEVRQLELFLAVLDCSSVTTAAAKVGLSPGAVSVQMRNLATQVKTQLFVRTGKRLIPTPAAHRLAGYARAAIEKITEIEEEFGSDPESDIRPFHFATGATALIYRLGRPLRLLRKRFPRAQIRITVSATEEMVAGLLDRRFDLALISLPFPENDLRILPLFEEELLVVQPSQSSLRGWHVGTIEPADLANQSFLLYSGRSNMRTMINSWFRDLEIAPTVLMEADDTEAIKRLVESGFGYSVLPEFALHNQPKFFRTYRVPGHRISRYQALAMPSLHYPRTLTRNIADFLQSALRK